MTAAVEVEQCEKEEEEGKKKDALCLRNVLLQRKTIKRSCSKSLGGELKGTRKKVSHIHTLFVDHCL